MLKTEQNESNKQLSKKDFTPEDYFKCPSEKASKIVKHFRTSALATKHWAIKTETFFKRNNIIKLNLRCFPYFFIFLNGYDFASAFSLREVMHIKLFSMMKGKLGKKCNK